MTRSRRKLACLLVALCAFSSAVRAQESLLIGPGDLLHIQVFATPELDQRVRVSDAGMIHLLLSGDLKVASLTPTEAAHAVEESLVKGNFLRQPRVSITEEEYATQKVSILGEVKNPGEYSIQTPRSVLQVLSLSGGLTDLADRKVLIQRRGSHEKTSYLLSNNAETALDTAATIHPGDTVVVPKAGIVYILGDVRSPGGYTMTNNASQLSVLELVARSGGTTNTAIPAHTRLIRRSGTDYTDIDIPLSKMQSGKAPDIALMPNDILYVPFSYLKNFVVNGSGIAATVGSAAVYRF